MEGKAVKFYDYSVKEILKKHFGENTVFEMRKPHRNLHEGSEHKNMLPLLWRYADEEAVRLFLEVDFLLETIIEDDYIAYISRFGTTDTAYLMFMITEDGQGFTMDINYAKKLVNEWEAKGYKTYVLSERVRLEYYHGKGAEIYEISQVNGKPLMTLSEHRCWEYYRRKTISVFRSDNEEEYECLFEPDVTVASITRGGNEKRIGSGIAAVKKLFAGCLAKTAYKELGSRRIYSRTLFADGKEINLSASRRNLICKLTIEETAGGSFIFDEKENDCGSLIDAIPELRGVRALDPAMMHGYAVQLSYSDGTIRNYYLHMFEEREIPEMCQIDGYEFTRDIFMTAKLDEDGNVLFSNGYRIPRHIAYYRAYRQLQIEHTDRILGENAGISIRSVYRTPLKNHLSLPEECFGPNIPLLDNIGNRTSDIALYSKREPIFLGDIFIGRVEPTGKYGYIFKNGTWAAPPVYNKAEDLCDWGLVIKVSRSVNGKETDFFITHSGQEVPLKDGTEFGFLSDGLISFNTEAWEGPRPDAGYYDYHNYELTPGAWGFMDYEGNVVIEPKYVYAIDVFDDPDHFVVARFIGDKLLWGVIDEKGNEVIPCSYPGLYSRWDYAGAAAFQLEKDGPFGLIDFDGNVILEPLFDYIDGYYPERRLVAAGEWEDELGLYSLDLKKMIIPPEYGYIDCKDQYIECETLNINYRYFDYNGKELPISGYFVVKESNGAYVVRKDGKDGLISRDGEIIIPPQPTREILFERMLKINMAGSYERSCYITCTEKLKGLSKTTGELILPQIYSEIRFCGGIIISPSRLINPSFPSFRTT